MTEDGVPMPAAFHHATDPARAADAAARFVAAAIRDVLRRRPACHLALSGGRTPAALFDALARLPPTARIRWGALRLYWVDERAVPPDDPASNYGAARAQLLARVPVPAAHVHPMPACRAPLDQGAREYEALLRREVGGGADGPALDLVLLGVGEDGHTASLFPGDPAAEERERLVVAVPAGRGVPPVARLTMTLPLINRARRVVFLATGAGKRAVCRRVEADPAAAARLYPAARVQAREDVTWFVDDAPA